MKDLLTVIYYTSSIEAIEGKAIEQLLKVCGDLPIVSVSHKPLSLGTNVCVGDQHPCDMNIYRQIQIACENATTPFVINAEADCLYPPDYFKFRPDNSVPLYRYSNVFILDIRDTLFYRKEWSECGQIANREWLLDRITQALKDRPQWATDREFGRFNANKSGVYERRRWGHFGMNQPIVNVKTGCGIRTGCKSGSQIGVDRIPYWGTFEEVKSRVWVPELDWMVNPK